MPLATIRPKGQITIPAQILQQWDIKPYDKVEVSVQNNVVMIVPMKHKEAKKCRNITEYLGISKGMWGNSPEEIQESILNLRK